MRRIKKKRVRKVPWTLLWGQFGLEISSFVKIETKFQYLLKFPGHPGRTANTFFHPPHPPLFLHASIPSFFSCEACPSLECTSFDAQWLFYSSLVLFIAAGQNTSVPIPSTTDRSNLSKNPQYGVYIKILHFLFIIFHSLLF